MCVKWIEYGGWILGFVTGAVATVSTVRMVTREYYKTLGYKIQR